MKLFPFLCLKIIEISNVYPDFEKLHLWIPTA
jgi:hypothetical protein